MAYNLDGLKLSRKADRNKVAATLTAIAESFDFTARRRDHGNDVSLTFEHPSGAYAQVSIWARADSVPLISWGCGSDPERAGRVFSSPWFGGNRHHKATSCPATLTDLAYDLDNGAGIIAAGCAFGYYVHPWAAETAWIGAGSPDDRPKAQWLEEYSRTGVAPSVSPEVQARRAAFEAAGGADNFADACKAAESAWPAQVAA